AQPLASLETLADAVQPIDAYRREHERDYTSLTPHNRLVDAVKPESEAARIFAGRVNRLRQNEDAIRKQLSIWRDSRDMLLPVLQSSELLKEDIPLAEDMFALARAGLEAFDYLDSGKPAPRAWLNDQSVLLELSAK